MPWRHPEVVEEPRQEITLQTWQFLAICRTVEFIDDAAKHKPIGISPHGSLNDRLYRQKKYNVLTDLLKRIRDHGVLVGLSAHDPTLIETAEEKGWDVDYYMTSLYFRTRTKDELRAILGNDLPLGEIYLPSDPPRMFKSDQGDLEALPGLTSSWLLGVGSGVPPRFGDASRRRLPTSRLKMRRSWGCTSSLAIRLLKMPPSSGRSGRGDEEIIDQWLRLVSFGPK